MRLFSKYYQNCSEPVYRVERTAILKARRAGCPRDVFSPLHRPDSRLVSKMDRFGQSFFDHLLIADTMTSVAQWCMNRSFVIVMESKEANDRLRASGSLIVFIQCQMLAIRLLVVNGLDTQARGLCRPLREAVSLLVLIQDDPGMANEFVSAQDPRQANEFWTKYVRKDRAKKRHVRALFNHLPESHRTIEEILKFISNEESYLSQSIHPSYLSGVMYIFSLMEGSDDEWHFLSHSMSLRTLSYSSFLCCNAFFKYLTCSKGDAEGVPLGEKGIEIIGEKQELIREAMLHVVLSSAATLDHLDETQESRRDA